MDQTERLDLYREIYAAENSRRNDTNQSVSSILTVATILGGGAAFLLKVVPNDTHGAWKIVYLVFLAVGVVCLLIAVGCLARAWFGFEYDYVAASGDLEQWWREMDRYDRDFPREKFDRNEIPLAPQRFSLTLIDQYTRAATFNRTSNNRKSRWAYLSKAWLIVSALALAAGMAVGSLKDVADPL